MATQTGIRGADALEETVVRPLRVLPLLLQRLDLLPRFPLKLRVASYLSLQKDFSISFSLSLYLFLCIFFFLLLSSSSFFLSRMTQGTGSRHATRNSSGFIHENTYFFFSFIFVYFFLSFFIFFHVLFSRNFKTEWGTFLFSWNGEYTYKFLSKILLLMKIC